MFKQLRIPFKKRYVISKKKKTTLLGINVIFLVCKRALIFLNDSSELSKLLTAKQLVFWRAQVIPWERWNGKGWSEIILATLPYAKISRRASRLAKPISRKRKKTRLFGSVSKLLQIVFPSDVEQCRLLCVWFFVCWTFRKFLLKVLIIGAISGWLPASRSYPTLLSEMVAYPSRITPTPPQAVYK